MTSAIPTVLERIIAHKRSELASFGKMLPKVQVQADEQVAARRDFEKALRATRPAIVAELKKASPSRGLLAPNYDPSSIARVYEQGGAAALSVLTDTEFFQGSLQHLEAARSVTRLPVLRKDFTIDKRQVIDAAAHGADAILLIVAILSDSELRDFRELAETFRIAALVEVHNEDELRRAVDSGAQIIGVNNRDLHTFEVHVETSLKLADVMPAQVTRVAESGIRSAADVRRLAGAGYHAFLVGEHLMMSSDPAAAIRDLAA